NKMLANALSHHLHAGESECLSLSLENPRALLLLDDLAAREYAATNELIFTGTLGCLIEARKLRLISELAPVLRDLRSKARFWISDQVETKVLALAGEMP